MNNPKDSSFDRNRLIELVGLLCDEAITDDQFHELEVTLQSSREARRLYHCYSTMAHNLEYEVKGPSKQIPTVQQTEPIVNFPTTASRTAGFNGWAAIKWMLAAALVVGLGLFALMIRFNTLDELPVACVLNSVDVVWESPGDQISLDELLTPRRLKFRSGVLHIRFSQGASVAIEGPADFEIINKNEGFLHSGQLAAYVPDTAHGFRVDTPQAEVINLGTEFGLSVDGFGESQLHVFTGEVEYSGHHKSSRKEILTAGLAVAFDSDGVARPMELKERSFEVPREVLWTRYRYASSISTQFIAGNTAEIAGGVPGRIGGGWTGQWIFECEGGEIDQEQTLVRSENPLGPDLANHLDLVARNSDGKPLQLKAYRGFESTGEHFDCRENYIVQFLLRINSGTEKITRIRVTDTSFDETVSNHVWKLVANRNDGSDETGDLKWRGLPLTPDTEAGGLVPRDWTNPEYRDRVKANRSVNAGNVYRIVVEAQPKNNRYRISMADGHKTLVGDWTKDIRRASSGDRLERRLEWFFESEGEISVSINSIRIQNDSKFDTPSYDLPKPSEPVSKLNSER